MERKKIPELLPQPEKDFYMNGKTVSVRFCPSCKKQFNDNLNFCPQDGTALTGSVGGATQPDTRKDSLIHTIIDGRYEILELLGEGGMGSVYRARHIKLEKIVAVKILQPQLTGSKTLAERFLREAQAASRLNHPHIIKIHDYGEVHASLFYMAMDYIEGRSLRDYLDWKGAIPIVEACYMIRQCLSALRVAHENHLVHRDIKPANIMIEKHPQHELRLKLLDFGTAKILDAHVDITTSVIGTPQYMSPEQAKGETVDARADFYSVGIILYEMVTGERPFQADTLHGYLGKHITEAPIPLRKRCPHLKFSATFEAVVMKALEKEPSKRYQNAQEFISALEKAVPLPKIYYLDPQKGNAILSRRSPFSSAFRLLKWCLFSFFIFGISGTLAFFFILPKEKKEEWRTLLQKISFGYLVNPPSTLDILEEDQEELRIQKINEQNSITMRAIQRYHQDHPPQLDFTSMSEIPEGTYSLGSPQLSPDNPLREEKLNRFYLDKYEVRNQDYFAFIQSTNHPSPPHWKRKVGIFLCYEEGEEEYPVTQVTWFDAHLYSIWAGKRLPSEWEYEAVCKTTYPWGEHFMPGYANIRTPYSKITRVTEYPKDHTPHYDVFQLAGNVREWMSNWYNIQWHRNRSIRGSSFKEHELFTCSKLRDGFNPYHFAADLGFRCAWDESLKKKN
jgi:serine/threonine protein kinase